MKVIQQRAKRADVYNAQAGPIAAANLRQNGENRRFRFSPGGWGEQQAMFPGDDWTDARKLQWPEIPPPQRVDDVVLDQRIELFELVQSSR